MKCHIDYKTKDRIYYRTEVRAVIFRMIHDEDAACSYELLVHPWHAFRVYDAHDGHLEVVGVLYSFSAEDPYRSAARTFGSARFSALPGEEGRLVRIQTMSGGALLEREFAKGPAE